MGSQIDTTLFLLSDEGGGFNALHLGESSLWFWFLIVFVILILLLSKLAWKPLMQTIDAREKKIAGDIERAEEARREAEESLARNQEELEQAAAKVKLMLEEARTRAETVQQELEAEARVRIQAEGERARREIEAQRTSALEGIKDQVVDIAIAINERLALGASAREDHLREAEALLKKLEDVA